MLAVLWAVYTTRWWLSGLLVGVAAGIKLTPAISGSIWSAPAGGRRRCFRWSCSLRPSGCRSLVVGDQTRYYFTDLLGDATGSGPSARSFNQSWRGGISPDPGPRRRIRSAGGGRVAVTAVLAVLAWRALERPSDDRLGSLLVVEVFGLLLSPISWTHHWVWLVPLMIWLIHGPLRERLGARILGWGWLALTLIGVPWLLSFAQPTIWQIGRPWYLAWAGLVYIVAAVATLAWIAARRKRGRLVSMIPLMSRAIATSFLVMPPSECVTRAKVTVRQRISMSG